MDLFNLYSALESNGMPVVCGGAADGEQVFDTCYFFDSSTNSWENYVDMTVERSNYAAAQLSNEDFWILGEYFHVIIL